MRGDAGMVDENFRMVNAEAKTDMIPRHRITSSGIDISFNNMITVAGHYDLTSGNKKLSVLSFNYDRKESDLTLLTPDQITLLMNENHIQNFTTLDGAIPDLTKKLKQLNEGIALWKYCILFVLVFLMIETLLLRFWKT